MALAIVCICFIPIGIMSFRTGGDTLLRHYVWVRYGGEWEHERATDLRERFNQFFESANRIGAWSLPGQDRTNFDSMIAVHPEWPLFILASIGLLYALKNRELRAQLFFPAVLTIAGLTATSPTAWRASIIGWLMIVFAVVGASMVLKNAPLYLRSLGSLAILVTQAFLFFAQAEQTVSTAKTHFVDGSLAKAVMYTCRAELRGRRVYLPEGQAFSLLQTLANPLDKIVFMPIKRFVPRVMDEPQVCAGTTNSKAFSVYAARHTPSHLAVRLDR